MIFTLIIMKTVYHEVTMGATITSGLKKNSVMLYIIHNSCKMFETVLDRKEGPGKILARRINKTT